MRKIFNFLYRGTVNDKNGIRLFNRGSITMVIQLVLVGLYVRFLDPAPKDMSLIKWIMSAYIVASYFFIKPNKI